MVFMVFNGLWFVIVCYLMLWLIVLVIVVFVVVFVWVIVILGCFLVCNFVDWIFIDGVNGLYFGWVMIVIVVNIVVWFI